MKQNLVDPVHFFDQRGRSVLSNDHLEQKLKELEGENARLRRIIIALKKKTDILEQVPEDSRSLH